MSRSYQRHAELAVEVKASTAEVFAFLDDPAALGAHMSESSAIMAGGKMSYQLDEAKGKAVGSVIRMTGSVLGLGLSVEEVVTERVLGVLKEWETRGPQHLLVISAYRMGFEVAPLKAGGSRVRLFIEYDLPRGALGAAASGLASFYARWCIERMARGAVKRFGSTKLSSG